MTLVLPWVILVIPEVRFRQRLFAPTPRPRALGRGVLYLPVGTAPALGNLPAPLPL